MTETKRIGLVLSGWAPAMTLMSGAMLGFMEKGVEFEVISASGTGALIALLGLAPKGGNAKDALEKLPNLYVSDALYSVLPFNVKLLARNTPFFGGAHKIRQWLPHIDVAANDRAVFQRIFNEWIDLACAAFTPSLEWSTEGLLAHSPTIDEMIDFENLKQAHTRLYVSAFDLNDKTLKIFENKDINADVYHAAESRALFFPPQRVKGGDLYYTGLTHDPTGLQPIWLKEKDKGQEQKLDMVLALDPLSSAFWREPTGLKDAFELMLANSRKALEVLLLALYARMDGADKALPPLYRIPVPLGNYPPASLSKWSHSNAIALQDIGRRAAADFTDVLAGPADKLEEHRFSKSLNPRAADFIKVIDKLFADLYVTKPRTEEAPQPTAEEAARPAAEEAIQSAAEAYKPGTPAGAAGRTAGGTGWWSAPSRMAVLVGGGAPELHFSAGALCAFFEHEISFDIIGASGAGALAGLLYAAPKQAEGQVKALRGSVNLNISDYIERLLPTNHKVFFKYGPFAEPAYRLGQVLPRFQLRSDERLDNELKRLYNDALDLMIAMLTPTTLNPWSKGMCTRVNMLDDVIDWHHLSNYPKRFYVNAFNLTTRKLERFDKGKLNQERFWAALAMPWLFEPVKVGGDVFTEGASHDPTGLEALGLDWLQTGKDGVDKIIAFRTVGPDMWSSPESIYDALHMTVIEPIVSLAELVLGTYGIVEYVINRQQPGALPKLYVLPFPVPPWEDARIFRWNYGNALTMWNTGHRSAEIFIDRLGSDKIERYRYYPRHKNKKDPRLRDMLALFSNMPLIADELKGWR